MRLQHFLVALLLFVVICACLVQQAHASGKGKGKGKGKGQNQAYPGVDELLGSLTFRKDGSLKWPGKIHPKYNCTHLQKLLGHELQVDDVPFGRGAHKVAFLGKLFGKNIVVKRPHANPDDIAHGYLKELRAEVPGKFVMGEQHVKDRMYQMFFTEMVDEIDKVDLISGGSKATHHTPFAAAYLGGCLGEHLGGEQFVLQEGPLLSLGTLKSNSSDTLKVLALPWTGRFALMVDWLRLVAHMAAHELLPCSLGVDQLGFTNSLRLRIIDLGHILRLDNLPNHTFGAFPCASDKDCSAERDHCMKQFSDNPDRKCNTHAHKCAGINAKTFLSHVCFVAARFFSKSHGFDKYKAPDEFIPKLNDLMQQCAIADRRLRPTPIQLLHSALSMFEDLNGPEHLAAHRDQIKTSVDAAIELWVGKGKQQCMEHWHCIEDDI